MKELNVFIKAFIRHYYAEYRYLEMHEVWTIHRDSNSMVFECNYVINSIATFSKTVISNVNRTMSFQSSCFVFLP